jgi:YesN/AraC family two-component response regulator
MFTKHINRKSSYYNKLQRWCDDLEERNLDNSNLYRNQYKKYCLSKENVKNLSEVNINALIRNLKPGNQNLNSSVNLPLKNLLQEAKALVESAREQNHILNEFRKELNAQNFAFEKNQFIQNNLEKIEDAATKGIQDLAQASNIANEVKASKVQESEANEVIREIAGLMNAFDHHRFNIDRFYEYTPDLARQNIKRATYLLQKEGKDLNISTALQKLRGSTNLKNMNILSTYGQVLEQMKRNVASARASRVSRMRGKSGGFTRKRNY